MMDIIFFFNIANILQDVIMITNNHNTKTSACHSHELLAKKISSR